MQAIAYYSGFLYCSFGRPYALVVTAGIGITRTRLGSAAGTSTAGSVRQGQRRQPVCHRQ